MCYAELTTAREDQSYFVEVAEAPEDVTVSPTQPFEYQARFAIVDLCLRVMYMVVATKKNV